MIADLGRSDLIDLSRIDADSTVAGNQVFELVKKFKGHAGQATLVYDSHTNLTVLSLDVDGDKHADAAIDIVSDQHHFDNFVL